MSAAPKLPPQNLEAEQCVLGAVLLHNAALASAESILIPDDFYRSAHQTLFACMLCLNARNEPIDTVTLADELSKSGDLDAVGGASAIAELLLVTGSASNIEHHARLVKEAAQRRALIKTGFRLETMGYDAEQPLDDLIGEAEQCVFQLSSGTTQSGFVSASRILEEVDEELRRCGERIGNMSGLATGYHSLDKLTAGLQPSDLVVIAGRPSMGKTSLAIGIAIHALVMEGATVAFYSCEMSRGQLLLRAISGIARIEMQRLRLGRLSPDERERYKMARAKLKDAPLFVYDTAGLTLQRLRGEAKRLKLKQGLDLIVVDYLQLLVGHGRAESRQIEVAELSRGLKLLAKEMDVPVICLSQLNRSCDNRADDKRPTLADLRDSGAIEQDADVVMFIYRDEVYHKSSPDKGFAEILIRKHRNGPTGDIVLRFEEQFARFSDPVSGADLEVDLDD